MPGLSLLSGVPPSQTAPISLAAELVTRTIPLRGLSGQEIPARVSECGQGKPVVFLHGLVGLNDHWEDVVRLVCPRLRCVLLELPLLDLRGDDCSIDGATELTREFLARYVGSPDPRHRPILVGNSFGGHVALRLALQHPELVRGLVLAGSSGLIEKSMVSDIQTRPSREWLERKIGELFFDRSKMRPSDVDRAHAQLSDRSGARAMVKLSRSARRNHLGERIREIQAPTLLIWGRQDVVTPPEAAHEFREKIRGSSIVWFDRCGHAPMIECPEQFSEAILEFAQELTRMDR